MRDWRTRPRYRPALRPEDAEGAGLISSVQSPPPPCVLISLLQQPNPPVPLAVSSPARRSLCLAPLPSSSCTHLHRASCVCTPSARSARLTALRPVVAPAKRPQAQPNLPPATRALAQPGWLARDIDSRTKGQRLNTGLALASPYRLRLTLPALDKTTACALDIRISPYLPPAPVCLSLGSALCVAFLSNGPDHKTSTRARWAMPLTPRPRTPPSLPCSSLGA